jgi:hypothetical protein
MFLFLLIVDERFAAGRASGWGDGKEVLRRSTEKSRRA